MGKLISVTTPLRPTADQARHLQNLTAEARHLHRWIRRWLRARAAGMHLNLGDALALAEAGAPLPQVADEARLRVPHAALRELQDLTFRDRPACWRHLPQGVAQGIATANSKRLAHHRDGSTARQMLPLLPLDEVPLDLAAQPLDAYHVTLAGLASPIVADLWRLPADLTMALLMQADDRTRSAHDRVAAIHERMLSGYPEALLTLYPHADALALQTLRVPTLTRDRARPHRADHVLLTEVTEPDGGVVPALRWSIRIPDAYYPAAHLDDTVGADVGVRNLVTLADRAQVWHVPRRAQVRHLPPPDPRSAPEILLHAQARRVVLDAARPELEAALHRTLGYRRAHIEALSYTNMREQGRVPWAPGAMQLSGAAAWGGWVQMLAPLTGTVVCEVDPAGTSTTCPDCGQPCERPEPYDMILCPVHGPHDADAAGARMIRLG